MTVNRVDIEHIIPQSFFQGLRFNAFSAHLEALGFSQNSRDNLIILYGDPDTVAAIQNSPEGYQRFLIDNGAGIVRHDSQNGRNGISRCL